MWRFSPEKLLEANIHPILGPLRSSLEKTLLTMASKLHPFCNEGRRRNEKENQICKSKVNRIWIKNEFRHVRAARQRFTVLAIVLVSLRQTKLATKISLTTPWYFSKMGYQSHRISGTLLAHLDPILLGQPPSSPPLTQTELAIPMHTGINLRWSCRWSIFSLLRV